MEIDLWASRMGKIANKSMLVLRSCTHVLVAFQCEKLGSWSQTIQTQCLEDRVGTLEGCSWSTKQEWFELRNLVGTLEGCSSIN